MSEAPAAAPADPIDNTKLMAGFENLQKLARQYPGIFEVFKFVAGIASLEQAASEAQARCDHALTAHALAKKQLDETSDEIARLRVEANAQIEEMKAQADRHVVQRKTEASDLVACAKADAKTIVDRAKAAAVPLDAIVVEKRAQISKLEAVLADRTAALAAVNASIVNLQAGVVR